jgi:hypothetical protein
VCVYIDTQQAHCLSVRLWPLQIWSGLMHSQEVQATHTVSNNSINNSSIGKVLALKGITAKMSVGQKKTEQKRPGTITKILIDIDRSSNNICTNRINNRNKYKSKSNRNNNLKTHEK